MSDFEQLFATAEDTDAPSFRRRMAISELSRSPAPGVTARLCGLLDTPDRYLRREVVSALARLEDASAIPSLLQVLDDEDDTIRREAIEVLGSIGDRRAAEALRPLQDDASYSIRNAAARAAEQIQSRADDAELTTSGEAGHSEALDPADRPADAPAEPPAESHESPERAESTDGMLALDETAIRSGPVADSAQLAAPATPEAPLAESSAVEAILVEPPPATPSGSATGEDAAAAALPTSKLGRTATRDARSETGEEIPPAETLPEEPELPAVDWNRARRMQAFFEASFPEIREAYETVLERRQVLQRHTAAYREVFQKLCRIRASEKTPLERCTAAIESAEQEAQELSTKIARIDRAWKHLNRQVRSVAYQVGTLFSGDKRREDQQQGDAWQAELEQLYAQKKAADERLQQARSEYDRHLQPLMATEEELQTLQTQRDAALEHVGESHAEVNRRVLDFLLPLAPEDLERRLQQLSSAGSRDTSLERIRPWLIRAVAEWKRQMAANERHEIQFQRVIDRLDEAGQHLTETLASGFQVTETTKQVAVRLQGEVGFQEDRSAFRGYSGASGTASGTGRGTASYSMDEVTWQPPQELPDRVGNFASAWHAAGVSAAERQLSHGLAQCAEQAVDDWVALIRAELESELPELSG